MTVDEALRIFMLCGTSKAECKQCAFFLQNDCSIKFKQFMIDSIEQQQTEIEQLKNQLHNSYQGHLIDVVIPKLEKEIEQLKVIIKDLLFAYQNKDVDSPHQFEIEAVKQAQKVIDNNYSDVKVMNSYCQLLQKQNNLKCNLDCKNCAFDMLVKTYEYESGVTSNE